MEIQRLNILSLIFEFSACRPELPFSLCRQPLFKPIERVGVSSFPHLTFIAPISFESLLSTPFAFLCFLNKPSYLPASPLLVYPNVSTSCLSTSDYEVLTSMVQSFRSIITFQCELFSSAPLGLHASLSPRYLPPHPRPFLSALQLPPNSRTKLR